MYYPVHQIFCVMQRSLPVLFLGASLLLGGCGLSGRTLNPEGATNYHSAYAVSKYDEARASLMQAYRDWKGTPYRLGGASMAGVDCSSLVSIIFDSYFGVDVPTNTRRLLNQGSGVRRASIRTGDLVFFRTGRRTLHVGIVVEEGEFLHASTSEGVTLGNIHDQYWSNRYLAARRVL